LRLRTRLLLILELLVGLLPVTASYLYHFPVGVFWTGQVIELTGEGLANAYTSGVAIAFVTGGVGLLGLWAALGALVVWPPAVPEELLVEIAKDDRLFLIVADLESQDLRPSLWGSFR
jgi:hypothetical protein